LTLQNGLLQALKIKRSNCGHSHLRNRNRNGKREQTTPSHAVLWVLHPPVSSARMPELAAGGGWGALPLPIKHQGRNDAAEIGPWIILSRSPSLCVAWAALILHQQHPGEAIQRSWTVYGSQSFSIPSCWGRSLVGTGTGWDGLRAKDRQCDCWKGLKPAGPRRAVLAHGQPVHRAMPVCSAGKLGMNSCN